MASLSLLKPHILLLDEPTNHLVSAVLLCVCVYVLERLGCVRVVMDMYVHLYECRTLSRWRHSSRRSTATRAAWC